MSSHNPRRSRFYANKVRFVTYQLRWHHLCKYHVVPRTKEEQSDPWHCWSSRKPQINSYLCNVCYRTFIHAVVAAWATEREATICYTLVVRLVNLEASWWYEVKVASPEDPVAPVAATGWNWWAWGSLGFARAFSDCFSKLHPQTLRGEPRTSCSGLLVPLSAHKAILSLK